jgi:SAM-dependent methyltransferase
MNEKLKKLSDQIAQNGGFEKSGELYHPIPFPEFEALSTSASAESAHAKWKQIKKYINGSKNMRKLSILDVGANAGFYTFNFAKQGAVVKAFEPKAPYVKIGKQIADTLKLDVEWLEKPIEQNDIENEKFDVALMLSVFQWMTEGGKKLDDATEMLHEISKRSKILFFELGCNSGKSAIKTNERPISWIWHFLHENTNYKNYTYLGTTKAWGSNKRYLFVCSNLENKANLSAKQRLITLLLKKGILSKKN